MREKQNRAATKGNFKGRVFQIAITIAGAAAIKVTSAAILWFAFDARYSAIARALGAAIGKYQLSKNSPPTAPLARQSVKSSTEREVPAHGAVESRDQGTPIMAETHSIHVTAKLPSRVAASIPFPAVPGKIHAQRTETANADRSKRA
jgi:hypothetical protein